SRQRRGRYRSVGPDREGMWAAALPIVGRRPREGARLREPDPPLHAGGASAAGPLAGGARLAGDQAALASSDLAGRPGDGGTGAVRGRGADGDHGGCEPGAVEWELAAGRALGLSPGARDSARTGGARLYLAGGAAAALCVSRPGTAERGGGIP